MIREDREYTGNKEMKKIILLTSKNHREDERRCWERGSGGSPSARVGRGFSEEETFEGRPRKWGGHAKTQGNGS